MLRKFNESQKKAQDRNPYFHHLEGEKISYFTFLFSSKLSWKLSRIELLPLTSEFQRMYF